MIIILQNLITNAAIEHRFSQSDNVHWNMHGILVAHIDNLNSITIISIIKDMVVLMLLLVRPLELFEAKTNHYRDKLRSTKT